MKKTWSSSLCVVSLAGALLCGCGEKEEIVPDMQKKEPAPAVTKTEAAPAPADEPELVPIQSLSQGNAQKDEKAEPAKEAPAVTGNIQPQEDGQFVIQVSIQPSKKGADAIVKKLAEQKIEAYVAVWKTRANSRVPTTACVSATSRPTQMPRNTASRCLAH